MKFIVAADLHIISTPPRYRIDAYLDTIINKVEWIVALANKHKATQLWAGDLFESALVSTGVINLLMSKLQHSKYGIYAVYGQHDLLHHHDETLIKSPLHTLELGGVLQILSNTTPQILNNVEIYGMGFGQDMPEISDSMNTKILLAHKCVTPGEPPWFLEDAVSAKSLLEKHTNLDYIVTGDYHAPHQMSLNGRHLINCGSIVRKNKDQQGHQPKVYLVDTDNLSVKPFAIPIIPAKDVFDLKRMAFEEAKGITIDTTNLVDLMHKGAVTPNYEDMVLQVYDYMKKELIVPKEVLIQIMKEEK